MSLLAREAPRTTDPVVAALDALREVPAEGLPALPLSLRDRFPDHRFTLVADREAYDGSVAHALIVRTPDGSTVSLAVGGVRELPWPLRGVTRADERDLLEVDGTRLSVAEAMVRLDALLFETSTMRLLIDGCLVEAELAADPVPLTSADVQAAGDAFRRAKGLHGREQVQGWLSERGMDAADFTRLVTRNAELAGLRQRVTRGHVRRWFETHRDELATVALVWTADAPDDGTSPEPWTALRVAVEVGRPGGVITRTAGELGRADLRVGDVVPLDLDTPASGVVVAVRQAVLDERTRAEAHRRLFQEWLRDRRDRARITWFWGQPQRTGS